jgi:alginate O-acetyltransferase complex protein AlgI
MVVDRQSIAVEGPRPARRLRILRFSALSGQAMLFNSYAFIFLFLPLCLVGFFGAARLHSPQAANLFLIAASLFFYGWWNPVYLPLLGVIMLFNFWVGQQLIANPRRWLLALGVAVDLGVLGYFKYANFLVNNIDALTGAHWTMGTIILPLAISFFTFQKIAFLVDSYKGLTRGYGFLEYSLFVAFFPQLIAGPIVHYREVLPQFRDKATYSPTAENFAVGSAIFAMGLAKKTVLADGIAVYADPFFAAAAGGASPDLLTAWAGILTYALQLYFDFSGYSDMAIGAARLFGIRLPENFNSPYKSTSIIDFWRRWHMTLSRFLREYLYITLGGNRKGPTRRHINLILTMLLGGLWHGAGWTFVLWGGLHGAYLTINHFWRGLRPSAWDRSRVYKCAAWLLTFLAVLIAWVPFRAVSMDASTRILQGMAGMNGVALPNAIAGRLGGLAETLSNLGVRFSSEGGSRFVLAWIWIVALLAIAIAAPNTQQIMGKYRPTFDFNPVNAARRLAWRPSKSWSFAIATVSVAGILAVSRVSPFLYFQF